MDGELQLPNCQASHSKDPSSDEEASISDTVRTHFHTCTTVHNSRLKPKDVLLCFLPHFHGLRLGCDQACMDSSWLMMFFSTLGLVLATAVLRYGMPLLQR